MPNEATAAEPSDLPPLRIHHFFIWSVVAAVALTVHSLATRSAASPLNEPGGYRVVAITTGSAAIVALAAVTFRGLAAMRRDWQPGHGLLVLLSLNFGFGELMRLIVTLATGAGVPSWYDALTWTYYLLFLAAGVASAIATRARRAWFWFFALWSVSPILWAVAFRIIVGLIPLDQLQLAALGFGLLSYLPCGLLLMVAIARERREGVSRHWTHWAGVLLWCVNFIVYIALFAYYATIDPSFAS